MTKRRAWLKRKRPSSKLDVGKTARMWGLTLLSCVAAAALLVVAWGCERAPEQSSKDEVMHCFATEKEVKCFDNIADYRKAMGISPGAISYGHVSWAKMKQYNFGIDSPQKVIDEFLDKLRRGE